MTTTTAPAPAESPAVRYVIAGLSAFVFLAVLVVLYAIPGRSHGGAHAGPSTLATVNAALNGTAAVLLVAGFAAIRTRALAVHKACMLAAFTLSSVFLLTYLAHHLQVGSVKFQGTGALKAVYYGFLIPHILLAVPVVPLALFTIYRGWTQRYTLHKAIARITLPVWLFVSVSGVVVYAMLYHL